MLYLTKKLVNELIEHSKKEFPDESCGILAGRNGNIKLIYKMINTSKSSEVFFMDPKEQLRVVKEIRKKGFEMIGIYHSHTNSDAYPSQRDVEFAFYPEVSYVIISLKDKLNPSVRSFKINNGKVIEERVKL